MRRIAIVSLLVLIMLSACTAGLPILRPFVATETPTSQPPTASPTPSPISPTFTLAPTSTPAPTLTSTPIAYGPDNFPQNVNPLTGLAVSDPALLNRRPLSIKIQIFPRGQRPPWGVSLADIVFDSYQNNGMTRFHAIFYGNNAEQVGPIRSARLVDGHLVRMYKTILAFGGADRRILSRFYSSDFSDRLVLEGYKRCPPMCRVDPNGYNYLVANTAELTKYATANGISNERQNLNGMNFSAIPPEGGQPATQIFVRYSISSYNRWDYDPQSGRYLRFQDTVETQEGGEVYAEFTDRLTGQQVAADNVVILLVPHKMVFQSRLGYNEIVDILLNGTGTAYAFRDGQVYSTIWNRPAVDSVLFLTFPDGKPYPFKLGNTWFQIIGQSSKLTNQQGNIWRFQFGFP